MTPDIEARREELGRKVIGLLDEFADAVGGEGVDMPVIADWVLVVSVDDAADPAKGNVAKLTGPHQFTHRSVGLLDLAIEGMKRGYFGSED